MRGATRHPRHGEGFLTVGSRGDLAPSLIYGAGVKLRPLMRQSWMVGRAVPCPPHDGSVTLLPVPMPDGGQRSARPTFPGPAMSDLLPQNVLFGRALAYRDNIDDFAGRRCRIGASAVL